MTNGQVVKIKTSSDLGKYTKMHKLSVVDHFATWCNPCKYISTFFSDLASENPDSNFLKVDVDESPEVAGECGVASMPTFQFYKKGKLLEEFTGADKRKLRKYVEKYSE